MKTTIDKPVIIRQPTLTKRGLMSVAAAISVALLLIMGSLIYIYIRLDNLSRENSKAIAELQVLTHPTSGQFREQLREGIKRCLAEPSCARLFPRLEHQRKSVTKAQSTARREAGSLAAHEAVVAHRLALIYARREGPPPRAIAPHRSRPKTTPTHHKTNGPRHPTSTGGGTSGSGGNPPPPPPPTATVQTHLPAPLPNPSVCTGSIKINC